MNKALGIFAAILIALMPFAIFSTVLPQDMAYASITVNDSELNGWEPSDIVSVDNANANTIDSTAATNKLQATVVKCIRIIMPILMIVCVCFIVYNAIRNIIYFNHKEKRVPMGELIKNMFAQFFFILFAWIIVEGIVFLVTGGETLFLSTLVSS